ncbi:hypothetical protein D3C80_1725860 [compost metagenome]
MRLEHPLKMALVGKPEQVGDLRQRLALVQQLPPAVDPGIEQVGMRGQPGGGAERSDQLIAPQLRLPGQ